MTTVNVYLKQSVSIKVELEVPELMTEKEIVEKAFNEFDGLTAYAGNGGMDKLVGVSGSNISIEPCEDLELDDIREEEE